MSWTPEEMAELTKLVNDGFSINQIAAKMGMTKNKVQAKGYRMGLTFHKHERRYAPKQRRQTVEDIRAGLKI